MAYDGTVCTHSPSRNPANCAAPVAGVRPSLTAQRRFAARASGLASGLAIAVRPAGLAEVSSAQGRVPLSAGGASPDNARRSGPVAVTP